MLVFIDINMFGYQSLCIFYDNISHFSDYYITIYMYHIYLIII